MPAGCKQLAWSKHTTGARSARKFSRWRFSKEFSATHRRTPISMEQPHECTCLEQRPRRATGEGGIEHWRAASEQQRETVCRCECGCGCVVECMGRQTGSNACMQSGSCSRHRGASLWHGFGVSFRSARGRRRRDRMHENAASARKSMTRHGTNSGTWTIVLGALRTSLLHRFSS